MTYSVSPLTRVLALLTMALVLAPSVYMAVSPQVTHAEEVEEVGPNLWTNIKTTFESTISAIKNSITATASVTSAAANYAMMINQYVLQPLAFVLSGNLLKAITAGVIAFVTGAANGTGIPQFIQDIRGHMQRVGDNQAIAFFVQFGRNVNSPFSQAIASSLRTNYLQNTSMAGFWAANRSTLPRFSTDINAYLRGDWTKGGAGAWFALTTQPQNNPYLLYQRSQAQLFATVADATQARLSELNWGQGFLSWCGPASEGQETSGVAGTAPGDACTDTDGNPGVYKTPGTVIKAALDKALGSNQDKLVQMGQIANEIGGILRNVGTVMQTVNFATQILGGSNSGGLFGSAYASGANNRSLLFQYQNAPGYIGITPNTVFQNSAPVATGSSDLPTRLSQHEASWSSIRGSATTASQAVSGLASFCDAAADQIAALPPDDSSNEMLTRASFINAARAQASEARNVLSSTISPVLARADAADQVAVAAQAAIQRVHDEAGTSDPSNQGYVAALQQLANTPPSSADVANALQDATAFGLARGSGLSVSGGSVVDHMSLIASNASALRGSVCTYVPWRGGGGGGEG